MSKPKTPVSPKRADANRANAAKSTGPHSGMPSGTPEGKARSSQNSRKHGFASSFFAVIRVEDADTVAHIKAGFVATFQPVNPGELYAIERMAAAHHSIMRCYRIESGLLTHGFDEALDVPGTPKIINPELTRGIQVAVAQNHNFWLAAGFRRVNSKGNDWQLFLRYQAQAERLYRRATEEFERLRARRGELPNEPIVEPELDIIEPVTAPLTDPPMVVDPPDLPPLPVTPNEKSHPPSAGPQFPPSRHPDSGPQPSRQP